MYNRKDPGFFIHQILYFIKVNFTLRVYWNHYQFCPGLLTSHLPGYNIGMMFHGGDKYLIIFTKQGTLLASYQLEHEQIYPKPGWVEHDPLEIWDKTQQVVQKCLDFASLDANQLAAIGITNQRETAVVWDKRTGKPYYNAIVWQDTRTDKIINQQFCGL